MKIVFFFLESKKISFSSSVFILFFNFFFIKNKVNKIIIIKITSKFN
jgi:hypothetical protein